MSISESIVNSLLIVIKNNNNLRNIFQCKARDFSDPIPFAEELQEWFLYELDAYEESIADQDDPDRDLMFSTILRSAIQNLGDADWNKLAQEFLLLKE